MKIVTHKHYLQIVSNDQNGEWNIQIQKDGSQIRIGTDGDNESAYIDTDIEELKAIRSLLTEVIEAH
jgi:hypothetical protein